MRKKALHREKRTDTGFLLAANRVALSLSALRSGGGDLLYWVRLVAFTLILVAIWDKNRPRTPAM